MRGKTFPVFAVGAVVATTLVAGIPAGAAPDTAAPGGDRHVITLITGDRVAVLDTPDGGRQVAVEPGAGRAGIQFLQRADRDRLEVIPVDAAKLVASGRLDKRLFDIGGLLRAGFDDQADNELPVIVKYRPGLAAPAIAGANVLRALPSVHGAALRAPKTQAGTFWSSISGNAGVEKIWLDGRSHPLDDVSNAQIGVPAAWQAGFTGKGVTVAVLDTGIDAAHPDLAGVIAGSEDFTGSSDGTVDSVGHGSHVASIIAGSGAGSAGKYRGVAPDAKILVGRVCESRFCDDSAVMAGMEWAAAQHAKAVNLSLGSDTASDGTDPMSEAVNTLTRSSGSLFVIAAGNAGPAARVGSPAAADAALTVASVGRTDAVSSFSTAGPRIGDFAVKPDIAAPGENIVAARAAGTSMGSPVDDHYTAASGTSMATPHVTATAAILAQAHPDWTAGQLKAGLMSTAKPVDGTVYGQGAGRVDIGRAATQAVHAENGSVSFGLLHWPFATGSPQSRKITYTNDGDTDVTLSLATSATGPAGTPAAAGAFTVDAATLTVPAHGSAQASLAEHPDLLGTANTGAFSGRVTATAPGVAVQTAFGLSTEQESFDVSVQVIDRNGKPGGVDDVARVFFTLLDQSAGGEDPDSPPLVDGKFTIRLPKGAYGVTSLIVTEDPANPGLEHASGTLVANPKLAVDHDGIALVFDARQGRKLEAVTDVPGAATVDNRAIAHFLVKTPTGSAPSSASIAGGAGNGIYAVPVRGDAATFTFGYQSQQTATVDGVDRAYFLAVPFPGRIPADGRVRFRDRDLHETDAVYHTQGVDTAIADRVEFAYFLPGQNFATASFVPAALPSRRLEFHSPVVRWSGHVLQQYLPGTWKGLFEGEIDRPDTVYKAGGCAQQDWNNAVAGLDLLTPNAGSFIRRSGNAIQIQASSYSPGEANHVGNAISDIFVGSGRGSLSRDGVVIGTGLASFASFTVPADTGRYTLALQANRSRNWATLATKVNTTYTFTSAPVNEYLALPSVKTTGAFDGLGRAKAGAPFALQLTAGSQGGTSAITQLSLEISGDDGATWQTVKVNRGRDGVWTAKVTNPAGGFASLRVKATNAAGNTVEQTTIRAYGLV